MRIDSAPGVCCISFPNSRRAIVRALLAAFCLILPLSTLAQAPPATPKTEVVSYHAAIENVKYVFGVAPSVAHLRPGNILDANSLDCFGNALKKPGDNFAIVIVDNPITGH